MKLTTITITLGMLLCSFSSEAQTELYVFKNVRREHLKAAKKARQEAREKHVSNDFYMRIRTLATLNEARVQVNMKKAHNTELIIADMNGTQLASIQSGELNVGQHDFTYAPEGTLRKPFVCRLLIDGKTEAMKVVKFNSF